MKNTDLLESISTSVENVDNGINSLILGLGLNNATTIRGILLELERHSEGIEDKKLPMVLQQLFDIERAIVASALLIANPTTPEKALDKAYKTADAFLDKKARGF